MCLESLLLWGMQIRSQDTNNWLAALFVKKKKKKPFSLTFFSGNFSSEKQAADSFLRRLQKTVWTLPFARPGSLRVLTLKHARHKPINRCHIWFGATALCFWGQSSGLPARLRFVHCVKEVRVVEVGSGPLRSASHTDDGLVGRARSEACWANVTMGTGT